MKMDKFSYQLTNFTAKSPSNGTESQIDFSGTLFNKSGDIDDLFNGFDSTVGEVKKNFTDKQVKYTELPRNLDFNSKYPSYPFGFTVANAPAAPTSANPTTPIPGR